jgi:hypothetical protein
MLQDLGEAFCVFLFSVSPGFPVANTGLSLPED